MQSHCAPPVDTLTTFDEAAWLAAQAKRGRHLFQWVGEWLAVRGLPEPLASRVLRRARPGEQGCIEGPAAMLLSAAESFNLSPELQRRIGIAATLFWAAADVADDVDDGEIGVGGRPLANDACALLFLATEALFELGPAFLRLGTTYGLRMASGQARDLAATGRPSDDDPRAIAMDKAGAELEMFFRMVAMAAGSDEDAFGHLGAQLGVALQLFSDVADVYISPQSLDLVSLKHTIPLARFVHDKPDLAVRILAADRTRRDVQAELRFAMKGASIASLAGLEEAIDAAWVPLAARLPRVGPLAAFVQWIKALLATCRSALDCLEEPSAADITTPQLAIERALRYLSAGPDVERHVWGLFGKPLVEGALFTTVFHTAALRTIGSSWREGLEAILRMRDDDGWRYYPGHPEIPPDADDAGLILGYLGDALPSSVREATVQQLLGALHGEGIHTWMAPMQGEIHWEGDDCVATLANAVWGLTRCGVGTQVPRGVWTRLLRHVSERDYTSPFYTAEATRCFIHRALAEGAQAGFIATDAARTAKECLKTEITEALRRDGSTSDSVLAASFDGLALRVWAIAHAPSLPYYLAARQNIDGSWAGEPLFMVPGVAYQPLRWGSPGLTTSIVVQVLAALA